jgi:hypothetical protein
MQAIPIAVRVLILGGHGCQNDIRCTPWWHPLMPKRGNCAYTARPERSQQRHYIMYMLHSGITRLPSDCLDIYQIPELPKRCRYQISLRTPLHRSPTVTQYTISAVNKHTSELSAGSFFYARPNTPVRRKMLTVLSLHSP